MIIDIRTYTIAPGRVNEYLAIYEAAALPTQQEILGKLEGYFVSETGPLNQLIHMWSYDNMGDRERRRELLFSDPTFLEAAKSLYPLIQSQENMIVRPVSFSPIKKK